MPRLTLSDVQKSAARKPRSQSKAQPKSKNRAKPQTRVNTKTSPKTEANAKPNPAPRATNSPNPAATDHPTFADLNLSPRLLKTLAAEGYETPTPIQARCIPPAIAGRDLLGCAQTGTGKTAAFSLPIIERLLADGTPTDPRFPRALILAPTRELAAQIEDSLRTYGRGTGFRAAIIYGGVGQRPQTRALQAGVDVIVATPGRLMDLMDQGFVDLNSIEMFVLDEADRMLDMGFVEPIRRIARELPDDRQTLFFSATMPPKIRQLADSMLNDPVSVSVAPKPCEKPLIDQTLYAVATEHKNTLLTHLLEDARVERAVVFTKTKYGAEKLAKFLTRQGVSAGAIHGNKSQAQRERALKAFRTGRSRVLVATDVAARGLDVDGITHVFNYNLPMEPEAYVHRIGRTGRAGATGRAIAFCSREERGLLRDIEKLLGEPIDITPLPEELDLPEENIATPKRNAGSGSKPQPTSRKRGKAKPANTPRRRKTGSRGERTAAANAPAKRRRNRNTTRRTARPS